MDVVVTAAGRQSGRNTYSVRINRPVPGTDAQARRSDAQRRSAAAAFRSSPVQDYDAEFGYLAATTRSGGIPQSTHWRTACGSTGCRPTELRRYPATLVHSRSATWVIEHSALSVQVTAEDDVSTETVRGRHQPRGVRHACSDGVPQGDQHGSGGPLRQPASRIRRRYCCWSARRRSRALPRTVDGNQAGQQRQFRCRCRLSLRADGRCSGRAAHYLKAANADDGDRFGTAIALPAPADLLAVGAPERAEPLSSDPGDNSGNAVGAVPTCSIRIVAGACRRRLAT